MFTITILAIIITITFILVLDYLSKLLGVTIDTLGYVKDCLLIISLFNIFFIIYYSLDVIVKADEFPVLATASEMNFKVC